MDPALVAANDQAIRTYGSRDMDLRFGKLRFAWRFIIANTPIPILGADFCLGNSQAVDLTHRCLFQWRESDNLANVDIIQGVVKPGTSVTKVAVVSDCPFRKMLQDRPSLTMPTFSVTWPSHGVQLHIKTTGPLIFMRARRLSPEKLAVAKQEFAKMEEMGIIQRSKLAWSSPLHMVDKKDGSFGLAAISGALTR